MAYFCLAVGYVVWRVYNWGVMTAKETVKSWEERKA